MKCSPPVRHARTARRVRPRFRPRARGRRGGAAGARRVARVLAWTVVPPVPGRDGRPISSTAIRRSIAGGDLARAADGSGRPYSVERRGGARRRPRAPARVPHDQRRCPSARKLLPPEGVYAVRVQTPTGAFAGMMNLGPRPTFGEPAIALEAHLFDADGDWYGSRVRVDFIARLRDTKKFSGPDELVKQLARDEQMAQGADRPRPGRSLGVLRARPTRCPIERLLDQYRAAGYSSRLL